MVARSGTPHLKKVPSKLQGQLMTTSLYDIAVDQIDGRSGNLSPFRGKVLLIVNVASKCGLTPQYTGLEALYESRRDRGLEVLGFPANNFGAQEPGTNSEIKEFCFLNYNVQFPMFSKISVRGDDQHALYAELTRLQPSSIGEGPWREKLKSYGVEAGSPEEVLWNFEKFLIGRGGQVVARFAPDTALDDPRLLAALDEELAKAPITPKA
jgi:glutathione peroxidase